MIGRCVTGHILGCCRAVLLSARAFIVLACGGGTIVLDVGCANNGLNFMSAKSCLSQISHVTCTFADTTISVSERVNVGTFNSLCKSGPKSMI